MKWTLILAVALGLALLAFADGTRADEEGPPRTKEVPGFGGKIAKKYEDSVEWWPPKKTAPEGTPNVVLFLLDDVGYAQLGCFGGLVETPNIDKLAANGLRYSNFHTCALCSPSRAATMAGRNPHTIGLGSHSLTAMGFPGYNAMIPPSCKSVANTLQKSGFTNYALGKWDHTPLYEVSQIGPFHGWPSGEGFDHFVGFMAADVHQFEPVIWSDHSPIEDPVQGDPDFHLDKYLADQAIEWITGHQSIDPDKPFMVFWASGSMHAPHHAPMSYIQKWKGRFDMGWDKAREMILERQKKMGIVPADTKLSVRAKDLPAWDSLSDKERSLYAKQMEVFAAQMEYCDVQIGRIVHALERIGELDNTLIMVTSDNGASGEGGLAGTFNETYVLNGLQTPIEQNFQHQYHWGSTDTYPHYHAGWASAGNTPFQYFKQSVHRGGMQDALVVSWPKHIKARGEIRDQYHHIIDIAPTILDACGVEVMDEIDGIKQKPFDGVSMKYSFNDADAADTRTEQLYEMFGNRALYQSGWKAVSLHGQRMPWFLGSVTPFDDDVWELYHVAEDFSESTNVADQYPEKLEALKARFDELAWETNVYPLYDDMVSRIGKQQDRLFGDRKEFIYYYPGAHHIAEKASPPVKGRSHDIDVTLEITGNEDGVLACCGGMTGGYSLFIKDGRLYYDYNYYHGVYYTLVSPKLEKGKMEARMRYIKTSAEGGRGELWINGKKVDECPMPKVHLSTFSLSETFDVGRDSGTQVSKIYRGPSHFVGDLDKVIFRLTEFDESGK